MQAYACLLALQLPGVQRDVPLSGRMSVTSDHKGPCFFTSKFVQVTKTLSLTLYDNTGAKLQPGKDTVTPLDIIYAVLQLDDDSTEAVSGVSSAWELCLVSA